MLSVLNYIGVLCRIRNVMIMIYRTFDY